MDIEADIASDYNSLPSFKPQVDAARRAVVEVGCILKRFYPFREESQTPHQTNDQKELGVVRAFRSLHERYLLEHIFESNGQLKSNPQVRLLSGLRLTFDSMSERVEIMRLLVSRRMKIGHDEQDGKDQGQTNRNSGGSYWMRRKIKTDELDTLQ